MRTPTQRGGGSRRTVGLRQPGHGLIASRCVGWGERLHANPNDVARCWLRRMKLGSAQPIPRADLGQPRRARRRRLSRRARRLIPTIMIRIGRRRNGTSMASNSSPGITIQAPSTGKNTPTRPAAISSSPIGMRIQREDGLRSHLMALAAQPGKRPCQRSRWRFRRRLLRSMANSRASAAIVP